MNFFTGILKFNLIEITIQETQEPTVLKQIPNILSYIKTRVNVNE